MESGAGARGGAARARRIAARYAERLETTVVGRWWSRLLEVEFVDRSIALAAKRPDLVRFEPWREARHTQEWNVDPERWDAVVRGFLTEYTRPV